MVTKKGYSETCSIPIGEGLLILYERYVKIDYYGPPPQDDSPPFKAIYLESGKPLKVESLSQIARLRKHCGVCLSEVLRGYECDFAKIVGLMVIGKGRIISSKDLFSFLEEKYDIQISKNLPRIENGVLKFLMGHFTLEPRIALWNLSLDLSTLNIRVENLEARPTSPTTHQSSIFDELVDS